MFGSGRMKWRQSERPGTSLISPDFSEPSSPSDAGKWREKSRIEAVRIGLDHARPSGGIAFVFPEEKRRKRLSPEKEERYGKREGELVFDRIFSLKRSA